MEAIQIQKISYGVDMNTINTVVNERIYDTIFTIAQGDPAQDGTDGAVKPRYDEVRKYKPKMLEDGSVDYRDLGAVVNISMGDPICDIVNETPGSTGKDVYGNTLFPVQGKPPVIPMGPNTGLNGDKSMLIALQSGNLVFRTGKFEVETVVTIKDNVDISTGNINFLGDVVVKGSVDEGFTIISEKDITISGMINGATLQAKGNIVVMNGCINSTLITREGSVTIGFGESCIVKCKGKLISNSLVSCMVDAEGDVDCVKNPGTIVGGTLRTMGNLTCNTLGHRNYVATTVFVGNMDSIIAERMELEKKIKEFEDDIGKINITLDYLQAAKKKLGHLPKDKEDFMTAAIRLKVQKGVEKKPLTKRMLEIDSIIKDNTEVRIKINRFLHPNVKITLGSFSTQVTTEHSHCTCYITGDGIKIV